MAKKFGVSLDLMRAPLLNVGMEQVTTFPASPFEGQEIHRTDLKQRFVYLNSTWLRMDGAAFAAITHTHTAAQITDLAPLLAGKAATSDPRFTDSRAPLGTAAGDLSGTYPNPLIGNNKVTQAKVAADLVQTGLVQGGVTGTAASTVAALRRLGTTAADALAGNTRLDQVAAPVAPVAMAAQRITGLGNPTSDQDAATKFYVDSVAQGLAPKASVEVATTANITLSGTQTIDGVAVVANDRVLVKNQTTAFANGIYSVRAAGWVRDVDADTAADLISAYVFVKRGTLNADSGWYMTTDAVTLGTTPINWVLFSGSGTMLAGAGLSKAGNVFSVNVDESTIEILAGALVVKDGGVNLNQLANGAVALASAKVSGTLPITKGGTNATTAAGARSNLGAMGRVVGPSPALTPGTWVQVTHGLGSEYVQVQFRFSIGQEHMELDWKAVDADIIAIRSDVVFDANELIVTIIG